jgi:hypothetical protein
MANLAHIWNSQGRLEGALDLRPANHNSLVSPCPNQANEHRHHQITPSPVYPGAPGRVAAGRSLMVHLIIDTIVGKRGQISARTLQYVGEAIVRPNSCQSA